MSERGSERGTAGDLAPEKELGKKRAKSFIVRWAEGVTSKLNWLMYWSSFLRAAGSKQSPATKGRGSILVGKVGSL